jgi:hypothetical protein
MCDDIKNMIIPTSSSIDTRVLDHSIWKTWFYGENSSSLIASPYQVINYMDNIS